MQSYSQKTGDLTDAAGRLVGIGYSGHGEGLNNPAFEADRNVGPIPAGLYAIGPAFHHPKLGPCVMALTPIRHNAQGRSGLFMHGDNAAFDHSASHGCIVVGPGPREEVAEWSDRTLKVIPT